MLNQNPNTFTFNGHSSDEFGIRIEKKPDLNRSARKFKSASVAGRNGNIYQMQDAWEEVIVTYDIYAGGRQKGDAIPAFTAIVEWLNSADDYAVLTDTYDPTHYRLAVFVDDIDIESQWHTIGKATVQFRCRPQRFLVENPVSVASGDTIANTTNHVAKPIITLTGNGQMSQIDLAKTQNNTAYTGASFTSAMIANLIDKYFLISFNADFSTFTIPSTWTITPTYNANTGTLTISGTSSLGVGMLVPVRPNMEYTFSTTSNKNTAFIQGYQISTLGYRTRFFQTNRFAGKHSLHLITESNTAYLLFVFFKDYTENTSFQSIMLAYGAEEQPFKAYGEAVTSSLGFMTQDNSSPMPVIKITARGFNTAVIDCEKENFSIDGVDDNIDTMVIDRHGNLSMQYIQLEKGNQELYCNGDIVSVTIDRRIWQL